jgi:hypothetical protein
MMGLAAQRKGRKAWEKMESTAPAADDDGWEVEWLGDRNRNRKIRII